MTNLGVLPTKIRRSRTLPNRISGARGKVSDKSKCVCTVAVKKHSRRNFERGGIGKMTLPYFSNTA